jgi:ABC-2 type transport system ATP-binding protein
VAHDHAIRCEGLRKRYADTTALDGFDLTVPGGVVYGLLGPNAAGKTTAVRVLATLLRADAGHAEVAGYDVATQAPQVRARIGLVGQHAALDEILSGRQNLELFGRLYHLGAATARRRATELLDAFGLAEAGHKSAGKYSGGMRRRLDLAVSFILAPPVLFLDEPTTGLDPRSRALVWQSIRELTAFGTTVLLSTQYLEEADQLATGISIIDHGRVTATGSPDQLKSRIGDQIDITLRRPDDLATAATLTHAWLTAEPTIDRDARRLSAPVRDRIGALGAIARVLDEHNIDAEDIALRRPTLDEVFLHLTNQPTSVTAATDANRTEVRA